MGHIVILVSLHEGLHQWPHVDYVWENNFQYFCAMPLLNGQTDTFHLKPLTQNKYANFLNQAIAGQSEH